MHRMCTLGRAGSWYRRQKPTVLKNASHSLCVSGRRRMRKENLQAAYLLQMLFSPFFLAAERQQTGISHSMRCLNNYGFQDRRVDCTWHQNQATREGTFYLNFSDTNHLLSDLLCWLSASNQTQDEFSCSAEGPGNFEENDEYKVRLQASSGRDAAYTVWEETYEPMRNIKCDPPYGIWSNMSAGKSLIVWKKPQAYVIIWDALQWQLQFRDTRVGWGQAKNKTVVTRETWMEIDGSEFTPGTSYVARVRCKTPDDNNAYFSQWSEWSTTTQWSVPPGPLPWEESPVLLAVFASVPLCLGTLLLLLLLSGFYSRLKSRCLASTPNPAAFFLPLYASHHGNFQAWIGVRERDVWLAGGKDAGAGVVTPRPPEAISQLSSVKCLSGVELPSGERVCCLLPGAPDQPDKASNYIVMQGEANALILPGRAPPWLEGEGFPYLPYKNSLFAEQDPQETEMVSSCRKASHPLGTSTRSVVPA